MATHFISSLLNLLTTSSTSPSCVTSTFLSGLIERAIFMSRGKGALRRLLGSRPSCGSVLPLAFILGDVVGECGRFVILQIQVIMLMSGRK
jgi:hypothetical protein